MPYALRSRAKENNINASSSIPEKADILNKKRKLSSTSEERNALVETDVSNIPPKNSKQSQKNKAIKKLKSNSKIDLENNQNKPNQLLKVNLRKIPIQASNSNKKDKQIANVDQAPKMNKKVLSKVFKDKNVMTLIPSENCSYMHDKAVDTSVRLGSTVSSGIKSNKEIENINQSSTVINSKIKNKKDKQIANVDQAPKMNKKVSKAFKDKNVMTSIPSENCSYMHDKDVNASVRLDSSVSNGIKSNKEIENINQSSPVINTKIKLLKEKNIITSTPITSPSFFKVNSSDEISCISKNTYTPESINLKKVFFENYLDVFNRLKLNTIPECLRNLRCCNQLHSENCNGPAMANYYIKTKKYLIEENRFLTLLRIANFTTNTNCFWGNKIFFIIFRVILTVKTSEELGYTSQYVIDEFVLLFNNLIKAFPPCWKKIQNEYMIFMNSEISTTNILPDKIDSKVPNIVIFVISQLDEICKEDDIDYEDNPINIESSQFFNYNIWEAEQEKASALCIHSREEKINRLFICLDLLNKILETDLSSWMIWRLINPSNFLFTTEGPLICKVFNITKFSFVSDNVKKILILFIKCVYCEYPDESIIILEKMISLLAVVSNIADIEFVENGISYPKTGQMTDLFVNKFFILMESIIGTNIQKYITIIETITIPFLKYKLINLLLSKIDKQKPQKFCMQVICDRFIMYKWLHELPKKSTIMTENKLEDEWSLTMNPHYAILDFPKQTAHTVCNQNEYLKLMLDAVKSYCEFYCMDRFALILMQKSPETYLKSNLSLDLVNVPEKDKIKFNYDKIKKNRTRTLNKVDYNSICGETEDQTNYLKNKVLNFDVLNVGLFLDDEQKLYLNDVQCMMKLDKLITHVLKEKYENLFDEWREFIATNQINFI